jgi:hypothetical protein
MALDQLEFELAGARRALLPGSLAELDRIVADARREGHALGIGDELRIGRALLRRDVREAHSDLPEIPPELRPFDVSSASHGRRYEIGLDVHPGSREAAHAVRRRYVAELRLVQAYAAEGLTLEAAWAKVRRRLRLDPPVRKLPRRLRRKVDAPSVVPRGKAAKASAATSAQAPAPAPAPAHPRWAPDTAASAAKPPAKEPDIPFVIATGIDGKVKWIP